MQLVPFDDTMQLPSGVLATLGADEFATGLKTGFPVISIGGKVFTICRSDEDTLVTAPDSDEPARSLDVVILRANKGVAKVFYDKKYVDGSTERPLCYSNDGQAPATDAQAPQHKSCQLCPHNQWGSRITEDGKNAKACSDTKRLAVAAPTSLDDAMLLRIPAMSLRAWDEYVAGLQRKGLNPTVVGTRIAFDYSVKYPALTFKPVGRIPAEMFQEVAEARESQTVLSIVGGTLSDAELMADQARPSPEIAQAVAAPQAAPPAAQQAAPQAAQPEVVQVTAPAPQAAPPVQDVLANKLNDALAALEMDD